MKPFRVALELSSPATAQALRDSLARLQATTASDDPARPALAAAVAAFDRELQGAVHAEQIAAHRAEWEQSRQALHQAATRFVRALKKGGPTPEGFEAIRALGHASARHWRNMAAGRQVDADTFTLAAFQKNPDAWRAAVNESLGHQALERDTLQDWLGRLRVQPGTPMAAPEEAAVAQAAKDAWAKALDALGDLGRQAGELDVPALQEAYDYSVYSKAFFSGDHATVATRYRANRHSATLFLRTFTPAMTAAAETFCEHESLAWQKALIEQRSRPKP